MNAKKKIFTECCRYRSKIQLVDHPSPSTFLSYRHQQIACTHWCMLGGYCLPLQKRCENSVQFDARMWHRSRCLSRRTRGHTVAAHIYMHKNCKFLAQHLFLRHLLTQLFFGTASILSLLHFEFELTLNFELTSNLNRSL